MDALAQHLRGLNPLITDILNVSAAAACSLGVLSGGERIYDAHFGYRDVEKKIAPDVNTIYNIASLSKAFTAAGLGTLVEEGRLDWNDVLSQHLPAFQHQDPTIREKATLIDFLSHRSGLATKMTLWMGEDSRVLVRPTDFTKTTTYLEPIHPLGSRYLSNNWCYGLLGQVIEKKSQQPFSTFLEDRLFKPLRLGNTYVRNRTDNDNIALPYMWADSGPHLVPKPPIEVGGIYEGAVGVKSSVSDLLTYYDAFMQAINDQTAQNRSSSPGLPFDQAKRQINPEVSIPGVAAGSAATSYALGWARSGFPSAVDGTSMNKWLVKEIPLIHQNDSKDLTLLYHSGSLCGYLASAILIPEINSAVIVLVNTLAKSDAADWIAKALLEAFLNEGKVKNDYLALAKEAAQNTMDGFPNMHKELAEERIPGTMPLPSESYIGKYYNSVGTFFVEIFQDNYDDLFMTLNDESRHYRWRLEHYHHNVWSWAIQYEDALREVLWPDPDKNLYLFEFRSSDGAGIDQLVWKHDPGVPEGETFIKSDDRTSKEGIARRPSGKSEL
jgi:CubicO group peptidase (beta-lactamase class C family)